MGMFDTVIVEGLKLKAPKEVTSFLKENNAKIPTEYQTKDLDNILNIYRINSSGEILEETRRFTGKKVKWESPFKLWKDNRSWLEKIYFNIKNKNFKDRDCLVEETKTVIVKSKITNTFKMLSYDEIGGRYLSLDYEVKVVEGKVKNVELIDWSIESKKAALERKKRDLEFKERLDLDSKKRVKLHSAWYYPLIKQIYNPTIFFTRIIIQSIGNNLVKISYRLNGV